MASTVTSAWREPGNSFDVTVTWDTSTTVSQVLPVTTGLFLYTVETNPTSGASYDLTLTNAEGTDLLNGDGGSRSATLNELISPSPISVSPSVITLGIAAAGGGGGNVTSVGKAIINFLRNK